MLLAAKNDEAAQNAGQPRNGTLALLAGEAADLVFHALVLLAERGLEPAALIDVLRARSAPQREAVLDAPASGG